MTRDETRRDPLRALDGAMVERAMQGGYVAEMPADIIAERLRAALVKPSETRTCPNCGDVLTGEEWEGHRLSEGVKP